MTAVVAIEHEGAVYVGCDSAITADDTRDLIDGPKWWRRRDVLVAFAGDVHAAQVARAAHARIKASTRDHVSYVETIARRIQSAIKSAGATDELSLLVVIGGRVYSVEGFAVSRSAWGYAAIGSGAPFALGSLASTEYHSPDERVRIALAAAVRHSVSCAEPLRFEIVR